MFRSIWQMVRGVYTQRRSGIDKGNIEHLRADLRFRLAILEYAYYGRSGKRVTRCLAELKSVLGERAMHRYLRTLDPDLRTQFVERFQGAQRDMDPEGEAARRHPDDRAQPGAAKPHPLPAGQTAGRNPLASNVVPIGFAGRRASGAGHDQGRGGPPPAGGDDRSVDSSD